MPQIAKKKSKGIITWPEDERPRERLLRLGPQSLTDAELLAIHLRTGYRGTNAVELARQILRKFGSLRALTEAPVPGLLEIKGMKGAKVAQVSAAGEMARRIALPDQRERMRIKTTKEAADYFQTRLRGLPNEHFRGLYLNRKNMLLEDALLSVGSVDQTKPPIRLVITRALQANATALIIGHNHPSGIAEASESDRIFTEDLIAALHPLRVKLLDHVIVGTEKTFSFADSGLLDELNLSCLAPVRK